MLWGLLILAGLVGAIIWIVVRGGAALTILLVFGIGGGVLWTLGGGGAGGAIFATILGAVGFVRWWARRPPSTKQPRVSGYQALNPLGNVEVVGESFYQDALSRIAGAKGPGGHSLPVVAGLLAEADYKRDPNAIAVWINGFKVGHLSREDAAVYAPVLHPLSAKGVVATCPAVIVGGWDRGDGDEGQFGVKLKLAPPAFVLDLEAKPPDPFLKDLLLDLREATTPRGRRKVLEKAAKVGLRDDSREVLLLEASKLEVEAALEKAASLKTAQAKRRVLETALAEIKADDVDDEHQAQKIAWLEQALEELERKSA